MNQRGLRYRTGVAWDKGLVLDVLDEDAAVGTYYWGRRRGGVVRPREEWLSIPVTPIVEADVHALAIRLRRARDLGSAGGRAVALPRVLSGLVVCGRCGASCQLETSGKTIEGNRYRYCYYSCRTYCRAGKEECPGVRVATEVLDAALLVYLADVVCAPARVGALEEIAAHRGLAVGDLAETWRALVIADHGVGRAYAMHLVERVELHGDRAIIVAKTAEVEV